MSAHYLIDLFTSPVTSAPIVDVSEAVGGQSTIDGTFVVRVPDSVGIAQPLPSDLGNLITRKYAGILAFYAGFGNIVYDDFLDATGVDFTTTPHGTFGARGSVGIDAGTSLQSTSVPLGSTPTAAVLNWEVFTYVDSDPKTGRFSRKYNEVPTTNTNTTAQVSFDGGLTFITATDGGVVNIPLVSQGSDLVVRITNATGAKLYIGGWSLTY